MSWRFIYFLFKKNYFKGIYTNENFLSSKFNQKTNMANKLLFALAILSIASNGFCEKFSYEGYLKKFKCSDLFIIFIIFYLKYLKLSISFVATKNFSTS